MNLLSRVKEKIITSIKNNDNLSDPTSLDTSSTNTIEADPSSQSSSSTVSSIKSKIPNLRRFSLHNISVFNDSQPASSSSIKNKDKDSLKTNERSPLSITNPSITFTKFNEPPPVSIEEMLTAFIDYKSTVEKLSSSTSITVLDSNLEEYLRSKLRVIIVALQYENDRWYHYNILNSTQLELCQENSKEINENSFHSDEKIESKVQSSLVKTKKYVETTPYIDQFLTYNMYNVIINDNIQDNPRRILLLAILILRDFLNKIQYPSLISSFFIKNSSNFVTYFMNNTYKDRRNDEGFDNIESYNMYRRKLLINFINILYILWKKINECHLLLEYFILDDDNEQEKKLRLKVDKNNKSNTEDLKEENKDKEEKNEEENENIQDSSIESSNYDSSSTSSVQPGLSSPHAKTINILEAILKISLDEFPKINARVFSTISYSLSLPNDLIDYYIASKSNFIEKLFYIYNKNFISTVDSIHQSLNSSSNPTISSLLYPNYLTLLSNFSSSSRFTNLANSASSSSSLASTPSLSINDLLNDFITSTKFLRLVYSIFIQKFVKIFEKYLNEYEENQENKPEKLKKIQEKIEKSSLTQILFLFSNTFMQFLSNSLLNCMKSSSDSYLLSLYHIIFIMFNNLDEVSSSSLIKFNKLCKKFSLKLSFHLNDLTSYSILYGSNIEESNIEEKNEEQKLNYSHIYLNLLEKISSFNKPLASISSFLVSSIIQTVSNSNFITEPIFFYESDKDNNILSTSVLSSNPLSSLSYINILDKMQDYYELNYSNSQSENSIEVTNYINYLIASKHFNSISPFTLSSTSTHISNSILLDRLKKRFSSFLTLRIDEQISFSSLILSSFLSLTIFIFNHHNNLNNSQFFKELLCLYFDILNTIGNFVKEMKNYTKQVPMFDEKFSLISEYMIESSKLFLETNKNANNNSPTSPLLQQPPNSAPIPSSISIMAKKLLDEETAQNKSIITGTIIIENIETEALAIFNALKILLNSSFFPNDSISFTSSKLKEEFLNCNKANDEDLILSFKNSEEDKAINLQFEKELNDLKNLSEEYENNLNQIQEVLESLCL